MTVDDREQVTKLEAPSGHGCSPGSTEGILK